MQLRPAIARRPGFTLVEMLVVLTIIVILLSLISGAVLQMLGWGPRLQAQSELSQLNIAVESFKKQYGMYPPSCIFLANNQDDYTKAYNYFASSTQPNASFYAAVVQASPGYLQRIFPKMSIPALPPANAAAITPLTIDWTGLQLPMLATDKNRWKGTLLEGDQCLAFFLGGMQIPATAGAGNVNQCIGFASDTRNPTRMPSQSNPPPPRNDPFYDFPPARLTTLGTTVLATRYANFKPYDANPFFVYIDPFNRVDSGMPYIYFTTYGSRNNYSPNDCLSLQIAPYQETGPTVVPIRFFNPNTFQIISAGADTQFGNGGYWNPGVQPVDPQTKDNQSNFNGGGLMGTRG
jgi:prepilin-type N-terminal cleavage/methylation domain-containing protein